LRTLTGEFEDEDARGTFHTSPQEAHLKYTTYSVVFTAAAAAPQRWQTGGGGSAGSDEMVTRP
jgi:hypothetical protein